MQSSESMVFGLAVVFIPFAFFFGWLAGQLMSKSAPMSFGLSKKFVHCLVTIEVLLSVGTFICAVIFLVLQKDRAELAGATSAEIVRVLPPPSKIPAPPKQDHLH